MKTSGRIKRYIDESIKVGDKIKVIDGSALTAAEDDNNEYYIIYHYPSVTGSDLFLKDIEGVVVQVEIQDYAAPNSVGDFYLQDIMFSLGNKLFRNCSQFVRKI